MFLTTQLNEPTMPAPILCAGSVGDRKALITWYGAHYVAPDATGIFSSGRHSFTRHCGLDRSLRKRFDDEGLVGHLRARRSAAAGILHRPTRWAGPIIDPDELRDAAGRQVDLGGMARTS